MTVPAGMTSGAADLVIDPTEDQVYELGGETIEIGGTSGALMVAGVTVTITDGGTAPGVTLTSSVTELAEAASATTLQITATLSGTANTATAVVLTLAGTATAGTDYTAPATLPTVTVEAGMTEATVDLEIDPLEDALYEPGGETIEIGGTSAPLVVAAVVVTITDDESAPGVTLTSSVTELAEGDAATTLRVTATLSGAASTETPVALTLAGTATAGTDYTAPGTLPTVTVDAGMTSATVDLEIDPIEDALYEPGGETIEIGGSAGTLMVTGVTVTITDDESAPGVTLTSSVTELAEGASVTTLQVTATLSGTVDAATPVVLTLAGTATAGTDYTAPGTLPTVTVDAGMTAATVDLVIDPTEDDVYEPGGETIEIGGSAGTLVVSAVVVTITDDESVPSVTLTSSVTELAEGAAATTLQVTATLSGASNTATPVVLTLAGTATAGTDYTAPGTLPTVTVDAGMTAATVDLVIDPTEDDVYEPGGETIEIGGSAGTLMVTGVAVTITDDESAPSVTLTSSVTELAEGASATTLQVTATLSRASNTATPVALTLAGTATAGTDYTAPGTLPTVTVEPGNDRGDGGP